MEPQNINSHLTIRENGEYRVSFAGLATDLAHTITFEWRGGTPAGTCSFSVDGDPGINNVVDLATESVRTFIGKPIFIDIALAGLPEDAELVVHFR